MLLLQDLTYQEEAYGFIGLFIGLIGLMCWGLIIHKMGYSAWFFICFFIPGVNIILMVYVAFAKWPVLKELRKLKEPKQDG